MGATYTRQSTYAEGDVIQATDTNDEFDQLLAAFAASTGHTHDGTTGEGGPVTALLGTSITIGTGATGTDITVTFDGESNDGVLKWMEDEDYFEYSDDILIASTEKLQFRDTAIYINSSADGQLDLVADTEIQIAATTIDINGAADISGNLAVGGNLTVAGNATVTGTTTFNGGTLTLGDSSSDNVVFGADVDSSIIPDDDDTYDLGSADQQWRNIFIDGTAEIDTLAINGTSVTSTAAELNILDGVTSTAAELNILDGVTSTAAELNILDGVTSTAAELNILDGVTSTAAEINIIDGNTSATSTTVVDADRVVLNDNGTMVQVAVTDLAAYFDDEITAMPNLVSTGALNSGTITSGFGTIDTGSSTITTTGLITGGSLDIDDVVINGSTIGHTDDTDLITVASGIATVAGELSVTTLDIGGTNVTSTAAELNILDGVTATAAELNIMDGVTSTAAELNILDGVTSTAAELNILDGVTSTAAELNALDGITAVVGELNALDLGSTAVGTAVASKAVILDSNKDYTGIRNLTLTGDLTIGGDDLTMATNTAGHILVADGTNFNPISVTDLSEIGTVADNDVLLAVDTSGGGLKKITRSTIVAGTGVSGNISNVSEDSTPQLGGNLDLDGNDIVTTSNATLDLAPNGTGTVVVRGNTNSGAIVFNCESNSHGQKVYGQPHSAGVTNTLMLPAGADSTLVSLVSTDTLTNKTLTSPKINEDVAVTSTATELNLLDGVTATTAELNILDGVTSTAAELNILDGVTSTAAELNALDGITAVVGELNALDIGSTAVGTAVASKAVILDSDKDYTGIRNFTITGNLSVGGTTTVVNTVTMNAANAVVFEGATADAHETTLTIVDPTADRTINLPNQSGTIPVLAAASNTAITATPAELNILDGVTSTADELNILDGVTATAAEINLIDGGTSRGTTAVADGDGVLINDAGTMRMTKVDTLSTYMSGKSVGGSNIVTTGALNSGTITSGFGNIDTGSSTITTTGLISGGSLDIDDVLINGSNIGHTDDTDLITVADGLVTVAGEISVTTLDIGGTNVTSTAAELNILDGVTSTAAELNALDGITAVVGELNALDLGSTAVGNAIASKAVILDSNKDYTGLRNVTATGAVTGGSAVFDGGVAIDNITIDGTEIDLSSGDLTIDVAGDIVLNADGGNVVFQDASVNVGELANSSSDFVVAALTTDKDIIFKGNDGGSIITALTLDMSDAGTATFNHDVKMGDLQYLLMGDGNDLELVGDGTNGKISAANGTLTFDVAGDIILDADGGDFFFKDGGTSIGLLKNNSSDFEMRSLVNDKDLKFSGEDGGSTIVALTLDMSDAGSALFNHDVKVPDNGFFVCGAGSDLRLSSDGSEGTIDTPNGTLTLDAASDIIIDADGADVILKDAGTSFGRFTNSSSDFVIQSDTNDKDIIFKGNDGNSFITALTLDMSAAGAATFNSTISDADGAMRAIPQSGSAKTSGYTLTTGDVGNFIEVGSSGAITIPNNTFSAGDAVSVFNNTTGDVTVTCSITTAYIAGTNEDKSSVTLATRGVCTVLFISATVCVLSGNVS